MSQELKIPCDRTISKPDNSCPKCGKIETTLEINPNTGTPPLCLFKHGLSHPKVKMLVLIFE